MTRGGLIIDQKLVDTFISKTVSSPDDLRNGFNLKDITGESEVVTWNDSLNFLSRGLCLRLQSRERKTETIKMVDIKGAIDSDDPITFLQEKGYSDKTIHKLFTQK